MKEIKAWVTTDGEMFTDDNKAEAHQYQVDLKKKINAWVDDHCWSGMSKNDVADEIYDHQDELFKIFNS